MITLESALLKTNFGVHGIMSSGCGGGVLSLTPQCVGPAPAPLLPPPFAQRATVYWQSAADFEAYPGWPMYPPVHSLATPHVKERDTLSHVAHRTPPKLKFSYTNLHGPLAQSLYANHYGAIAAPTHYTH